MQENAGLTKFLILINIVCEGYVAERVGLSTIKRFTRRKLPFTSKKPLPTEPFPCW